MYNSFYLNKYDHWCEIMDGHKNNYSWFYDLNLLMNSTLSVDHVPAQFKNAYKLYHHPRKLDIKRSGGRGYMCPHTGNRYDGLTRSMESTFFPMQTSEATGGAKTGGSSRGNMTDKELCSLVNDGVVPVQFSHYTMRTLDYLRKHDLKPFVCQFLVFDKNLCIATELDILAVDMKSRARSDGSFNNVVNIQLKTGYNNNYESWSSYFQSPFLRDSKLTLVHKSHRNVHHLQNMIEHMMVWINYDQLLSESVVLVISEVATRQDGPVDHNALYRIPRQLTDVRKDVYINLKMRLSVDELAISHAALDYNAMQKKAKTTFL